MTKTTPPSPGPQSSNTSQAQPSAGQPVTLGLKGLPLRVLPTGEARQMAVEQTLATHRHAPNHTYKDQPPKLDANGLPIVPNRQPYTTEIRVQVTIDSYKGVPRRETRNGLHEYAEAHIVNVMAVAKPANYDANDPRVHLAMNVASPEDAAGLPQEIPLAVGQQIELQGEYIPASQAHGGGPAVLHFTHWPAGYVTIDGKQYK